MGEKETTDIRLREIYVNLKNYDFDINGSYKMDQTEANKFIECFEEMEGNKNLCKEKS